MRQRGAYDRIQNRRFQKTNAKTQWMTLKRQSLAALQKLKIKYIFQRLNVLKWVITTNYKGVQICHKHSILRQQA